MKKAAIISDDRLAEIEREARERIAHIETTALRMSDSRTGRTPDVGIVPSLCRTILELCAARARAATLMPRPRPVHNLSPRESALALAIADERVGLTRNARLAETIEAYWRARGFSVAVRIEGDALCSEMINGMPKTKGNDDGVLDNEAAKRTA